MAPVSTDTPLADLKVQTISQDEYDKSKKRPPPKNSAPKKSPLPPWKDGVIAAFMTNLYETAGDLLLAVSPDPEAPSVAYGTVFKAIAENCGRAWEEVAKDSPYLRRWIYSMMQASKLSKLMMAHMPLMIVALHQHGPLRQATNDIAEDIANGNYTVPAA